MASSRIFNLIILITTLGYTAGISESATTMKEILDDIFRDYDKGIRPHYGEKAAQVGVTVYILSLDSFDELNMELGSTFYFRQTWDDPRLSFRRQQHRRRHNQQPIILNLERANLIWRPDTFFVNEKTANIHDTTGLNEFVRIQANGTVLLSSRYSMKTSCPMNLQYFPFDKQSCSWHIESYATSMQDTVYYWAKGEDSLDVSPDVSLPGVKLVGHNIRAVEISLNSRTYSRLTVTIEFQRAVGYYIIRYYIPMTALVLVSLLTLVFSNPVLEPLIHVIAISFLIFHSEVTWMARIPMISYISALYLYFFICIVHMLLSLFVSLGGAYRHLHHNKRDDSVCGICKPLTELDNYRGKSPRPTLSKSKSCSAGSFIICVFKMLVIGCFVGSVVVYWLFYRAIISSTNQNLTGMEQTELKPMEVLP